MKLLFVTCFCIITLISCDGGLAPKESGLEYQTGFGGTVSFVGNWSHDITYTNIVLFKDPILSEEDFNIQNLKYLSTPIPLGSDEYNYTTVDSILFGNVEPGKYSYLAVVQSTSEELSLDRKDWFVVGIYNSDVVGWNEGEIIVEESKFEFDVDIVCDFNNPPPQPPGGN